MIYLKEFATEAAYDAAKDGLLIPNVSLITENGEVKYLKESGDGHEYVDLGLPNGTLWAAMNVGANSETEIGNYYMYGKGARQYNSEDGYYEELENPLAASADTATQVLGEDCHTPTESQFDELTANTTFTWETNFNGSGISGGKFTNKSDSTKYIFLPAAGYYDNDKELKNVGVIGAYWTSTPHQWSTALMASFNNESAKNDIFNRKRGLSIRPVKDA